MSRTRAQATRERSALMLMAGVGAAPTAPAGTAAAAPATSAQKPAQDDADELDIHVKKGGGWWPFFLGVGVGVAGSVVVYKLVRPSSGDDSHLKVSL